MTIIQGLDGHDWSFSDLPAEKFPVSLSLFSPAGDLVHTVVIEPYVAVKIPGLGPGAVRYIVALYGDGTGSLHDDPSCGDTVDVVV